MCGIVGAVSFDRGLEAVERRMPTALRQLKHRGPDADGFEALHNAILGHVHLRIVDQSRSNRQPMQGANGEVIVFNGEIYNFRKLRESLLEQGCRFATDTDTEVILGAYAQFGSDLVHHLQGIFSFALFDSRGGQLVLARDRLGVKPLFYAEYQGIYYFGSEPAALLACMPSEARAPNPAAVQWYLTLRQCVGTETLYQHIKQLLPGCCAVISKDGLRIKNYWRPGCAEHGDAPAGDLQEILRKVVASQADTRLPISLFLSGGLDSSVLGLELASRLGSVQLSCFTARQPFGYDETSYAAAAARSWGGDILKIPVDQARNWEALRRYIKTRGLPAGMHNEMETVLLAEAASKKTKIVYSGEGADELFCGYGRIQRWPFVENRWRLFQREVTGPTRMRRDEECLDRFLQHYAYTDFNAQRSLGVELCPELKETLRAIQQRSGGGVSEQFIQIFFLQLHLPALLQMLDGATAYHGIEARVPFCDEHVVEFSRKTPFSKKIAWRSPAHRLIAQFMPAAKFSEACDMTKAPLRKRYQSSLPPEIIDRKKQGFPTPLAQWIHRERQQIEALLIDGGSRLSRLVDPNEAVAMAKRFQPTDGDRKAYPIWLLTNLAIFTNECF
jgi:asparagine synthase (glutamine-hydrolysing)